VRHRFAVSVLASLILVMLSFLAAYQVSERNAGFLGPLNIYSKNETMEYISFHSPGWTVLNVSCNGNGKLFLMDESTGRTVFSAPVVSHINTLVEVPHPGSYALYTNGSLYCSAHSAGFYPTTAVQGTIAVSIGVLSVLIAFLLWRWWR